MTNGEYLGAGSGITKALYRLSDVNDSSGNGNTLTNNNSVSFVSGKFGNCADYGSSNTNKFLGRAGISSLNGDTQLTFSTWVNITSNPANNTIACWWFATKRSSASDGVYYQFGYRNDAGTLKLKMVRIGSSNQPIEFTTTLSIGIWYHIGYTFNGSTQKIYLNGNEVTSGSASGKGNISSFPSVFNLGMGRVSPEDALSGKQDETIYEEKVWTASDFKKYYTYAKGRFNN